VGCIEFLKLRNEVNKYDRTFAFFKMSMPCFIKIVFKVYDIMLAFTW
jgi:hypothetical protein